MNTEFDPRIWNLFTGVALLTAGCGSRVAASDAGETGETGETAETVETTAEGPECVTDSDCPDYYSCNNGVCEYYHHHDGWVPYYECYSDEECGEFEICDFGYCEMIDSPPQLCSEQGLAFPPPLPIEVTAEVLTLTFADVDADGQDEIVTATATELVVYESGGMAPTASALQSGTVKDIVAGDFDGAPGEDVILLIDEALIRYGSNGDGSFAMPITTLPVLGSTERLLAAELDGQPPTDLIGWGGLGAFIEVVGEMSVFSNEQYQAGAVHEFGSPEPSFALLRGELIDFYWLDGNFEVTHVLPIEGPPVLAALARGSVAEYVNLLYYSGWSLIQAHDLSTVTRLWTVFGSPEQMVAGDIDGDGNDELLFFDGSIVALERDPGGPGDCWHELPAAWLGTPSQAVVGDWDGDGNEEFAIRTDFGELVLFDGG